MKDTAVITVYNEKTGIDLDYEVPLDITANDLIIALSNIFSIPIKKEHIFNYYIRSDSPKALLIGENRLRDYGIRDGSKMWLWK